jgi:DNA-binding beta-propeller fold protein YncE
MRLSRGTAALLAMVGLLTTSRAAQADPYFALVGWRGEFARIDAATGEVTELPQALPHGLQALALGPDGVLYGGPGDGRDLYTIDPTEGTGVQLQTVATDIRGMAFSPDGDLYVTAREHPAAPTILRIVDLTDGSYVDVGELGIGGVQAQGLAFSPDGVLYTVRPNAENYDLFTIDLDDTELHLVGSHPGALHQGLAFAPDGSLYAVGYSIFGQLNPGSGAIIGDTIALSGDYRGMAYIAEPGTILLLSLSGLAFLRRRRPRRT